MFSINDIISEKFKIVQLEQGFRFSTDSIYLAWFVRRIENAKVIDVGAGSGIISVLLNGLYGFDNIDAIEMQDKMYECLNRTVSLLKVNDKITPIHVDIKDYKPDFHYDVAVCNPPYRNPEKGRVPEDETELNARFTTTLHVRDVFRFCKSRLKNKGSLYLSYDADMLQDLFEAAIEHGFEAKRLMPVCPDINIKPKIVLAEFRRGSGREMIFEAPLYQKINGEQSESDRKIMSGEWDD